MKKKTSNILKETFQGAAVMLAQFTTENPGPAAKSAGILYDNIASGLALHNLKKLFRPKH